MLKFRALATPMLAIGLLAGSLAPSTAGASPTVSSSLKIHPFLQYGAQAEPLRTMRVIVQKTSPGASATSLASKVLGHVVEEFKVVPAFVLELPQGSISTLALDSNVRYISPDGPVQVLPQLPLGPTSSTATHPQAPQPVDEHHTTVTAANLQTTFPFDAGAPNAWSGAANWDHNPLTGANVAVAVLDSGIDPTHADLNSHVVAVNVNRHASGVVDGYGHGTHVAGIIAGHDPTGQYLGIAPNATLLSVKVTDDTGSAYESDLLRGMDWVSTYRAQYNVRVVNLSVTTSLPESYAISPVDAAVEALYHQNVTVVAAAGNLGSAEDAVWYAPGNDPLAITVGCLDDNQTTVATDDSLCSISSRGVTEDGFAKPDLVAPGRKVISALAAPFHGHDVTLAQEFPDHITADGRHIRLSGTSMAAPVVSGAIALLLERAPGLSADLIRQILVTTANTYPGKSDTAGAVNIPAAIASSQHPPNHPAYGPLPVNGSAPPAGSHTLVWDGGSWGNVYWSSAHWDSAHWDSAHWDSAYWDSAHWDSAHWDSAHWDSAYWDSAHWDSAHWDGSHWNSAHWDAAANYD